MNKKPKKYYFKERKGFDTPQYAGAFPYVDYASYVDLKQNKNNLIDFQEQTIKELRDQLTSVYEDIIELMSNEMGGIDKRTLEAEALNWIKR